MGAVVKHAETERPETVGVADGDHGVRGHEQERVSTLDTGERGFDRLLQSPIHMAGHQVDDDLAVHGGLEDRALLFQVPPQGDGVDQVAVVGDADRQAFVGGHEGLGIDDVRLAGGGIADMTGGQVAGKALQGTFAEDIGNQAHVLVNQNFFAVSGHNAGAFLAAMLEGIQSEIDKLGGVLVAENPTDAAFMPGFYREFTIGLVGVHIHCLQYGQDAPKIERHKGRFLVPVLLSIQPISRSILTTRLHVFFQQNIGYRFRILQQAAPTNLFLAEEREFQTHQTDRDRQGRGLSRQIGPGGPGPDTVRT